MTKSIGAKKYLVTTYATAEWQCIVEADSKEEAEEKVWEGDYDELNNGNPTNIQDEQIESIVEQPNEIIDKIKEEDNFDSNIRKGC
tara:strand:- start:96 stop:353 length:258 start_codon:yes stop_codon:yes gene_type:complete